MCFLFFNPESIWTISIDYVLLPAEINMTFSIPHNHQYML